MSTPATTATPTCGARPDPLHYGSRYGDVRCLLDKGHSGTCVINTSSGQTGIHYVVHNERLTHGLRHDDNEQTIAAPTCEHEDIGPDMDGTSARFCCERTATKRLVGRDNVELALLCDEHGAAALDAMAEGGIVRNVVLQTIRPLRVEHDRLLGALVVAEDRVAQLVAMLARARATLSAADLALQSFQDEHTPEECGL